MILTSVTMVGWADVPDSDRGDFRRQRAVDISSLVCCRSRTIMTKMNIAVMLCKCCIEGLVQDCSNSIANALELLQSCTKPSVCTLKTNSSNILKVHFSMLPADLMGPGPVFCLLLGVSSGCA